jgi:hypothetical protein
MMINRKGQSPTIGVIIAIVLGIALIVFLIWGFSTNWSIFSSTAGAFSGKSTVDSVQQACQMHCENNIMEEFCRSKKSVSLPDGTKITDRSCYELHNTGIIQVSCTNLDLCPTCKRSSEESDVDCSKPKTETDCKKIEGCTWK